MCTTSTTRILVPPMELKDLLGGKGANLAEMTSVLGLPVPHGLHHLDRRLPGVHVGGWPDELDAEVAEHLHEARGAHGQADSATRTTRCWSRCAREPSSPCPA